MLLFDTVVRQCELEFECIRCLQIRFVRSQVTIFILKRTGSFLLKKFVQWRFSSLSQRSRQYLGGKAEGEEDVDMAIQDEVAKPSRICNNNIWSMWRTSEATGTFKCTPSSFTSVLQGHWSSKQGRSIRGNGAKFWRQSKFQSTSYTIHQSYCSINSRYTILSSIYTIN